VKVIGSDVPDLEDLPKKELKKLFDKCKEVSRKLSDS
jgi:diadenosine tetraphosphate (Ap4A) HIT family hydrolase